MFRKYTSSKPSYFCPLSTLKDNKLFNSSLLSFQNFSRHLFIVFVATYDVSFNIFVAILALSFIFVVNNVFIFAYALNFVKAVFSSAVLYVSISRSPSFSVSFCVCTHIVKLLWRCLFISLLFFVVFPFGASILLLSIYETEHLIIFDIHTDVLDPLC